MCTVVLNTALSEGCSVGRDTGAREEPIDGFTLGVCDCTGEGCLVALLNGLPVTNTGTLVGTLVTVTVGLSEGSTEGITVGDSEGAVVGSTVGVPVLSSSLSSVLVTVCITVGTSRGLSARLQRWSASADGGNRSGCEGCETVCQIGQNNQSCITRRYGRE